MSKKTEAITTKLPLDIATAIKIMAGAEGKKPSVWLRDLATEKVLNDYLQAKNTVEQLSMLDKHEKQEKPCKHWSCDDD